MAGAKFIAIKTPNKQFDPPPRCIYCYRKLFTRHKEHIIPYGLAADSLVFRRASCVKCAKKTHAFETTCLRQMWWPFRAKLGIPSRNKRDIPAEFGIHRLGQFSADNRRPEITRQLLPIKDFPLYFLTYVFEPPGVLTGRPGRDHKVTHYTLIDKDESSRQLEPGEGFRITGNWISFCKLLGKIAHAYAVAILGLDAFASSLALSIRDKAPDVSLLDWIGGAVEPAGPPNALHEIELRLKQLGSQKFIVVYIRLFASLSTPRYEVVVGLLNPSFNQFSLFEDPLYRIEIESPLPLGNIVPVTDVSGLTRAEMLKFFE